MGILHVSKGMRLLKRDKQSSLDDQHCQSNNLELLLADCLPVVWAETNLS